MRTRACIACGIVLNAGNASATLFADVALFASSTLLSNFFDIGRRIACPFGGGAVLRFEGVRSRRAIHPLLKASLIDHIKMIKTGAAKRKFGICAGRQ